MYKFARRLWTLTIVFYLVLVAAAVAATVHPAPTLVLQSKQIWVLLIGALVPLGTYVLNHVGPWVSEPVKAFVTVLVAAIAGGLYTALATSSFGFNSATLEMVLTAVVAALGAHQWLWKPSTISAKLGGGSNATGAGRHLGWVESAPAAPEPVAPAAK